MEVPIGVTSRHTHGWRTIVLILVLVEVPIGAQRQPKYCSQREQVLILVLVEVPIGGNKLSRTD